MDKTRLRKALLAAFPLRERMAMLLAQYFDRNYATLTAPGPLDVEYFQIITQAEAEGWLLPLARAAYESVPGNPLLADLVLAEGLSSARPLTQRPAAGDSALQRLVRERSDFVDVAAFMARLAGLEGQTCRIERALPAPKAIGTGFLVGPDLVMTNQHVIADLTPADRLLCRFDYLTDAQGVEVRAGRVQPLAEDWLLASAPPDAADSSLDESLEPEPENLDFALLRLAEPLGEQPRQGQEGPGNPPRGWMTIDPTIPAGAGDDLLILQHPQGAPLKLGLGRLTELRAHGLRWRHDVATEPGSSGAPVFNRNLDLIGLHHAGDPNFARTAAFNQAVPLAAIIGRLTGQVDPFWTQVPP
ncbi:MULTISPECIES: trypsin-like peptidase domain-containing protein [unclassified Paracoccus (in: a-proteobacteria)]|uniref:trypsin-like peptidase domain-containing protein n=1 Tax=unclassified Paracoccus (in: a-proteobacteria) TaxID=2688777 RepID=UPI0012B3FA26|nr:MULTISPECIES: trypsin-like peptidase domain-containing protein [unclassified Paracoccus (in: a-proteobacteria)]UXU76505.1 trypsin-like peptidase domain-containing protein [Paracoccus sp. SMMA_5]UXU82428.1 trypsin-like peptidase domain-containing protein [Paracoccus sp. SMMA_5_TC]